MPGPHRFTVGDRVRCFGGYDAHPDWLAGGDGYIGTIRHMTEEAATVELDREVVLAGPDGRKWEDFGRGSASALRTTDTARGRWLVLTHAWAEQTWVDPVRLQVGLCEEEPDLSAIPAGGGIGYWVESHASIALAR